MRIEDLGAMDAPTRKGWDSLQPECQAEIENLLAEIPFCSVVVWRNFHTPVRADIAAAQEVVAAAAWAAPANAVARAFQASIEGAFRQTSEEEMRAKIEKGADVLGAARAALAQEVNALRRRNALAVECSPLGEARRIGVARWR